MSTVRRSQALLRHFSRPIASSPLGLPQSRVALRLAHENRIKRREPERYDPYDPVNIIREYFPEHYFPPSYFDPVERRRKRNELLKYFAKGLLLLAIAGGAGWLNGKSLSYGPLKHSIPHSDEDSLTLFKPANIQEMQAEEYINNHPLTLELRANPAFKESRPTLKLREDLRTSSLTSGVLAGPGRIVVPPVMFVEEGGKSSVVIMYLGNEMCGYPGMIHGGILATLLDEGLARCAFEALPNKLAMTATLNINYRKPSPADNFVVLRARTTKVERRKAWVEGQIETLPKTPEEAPVVLAEATALMIEPRQAEQLHQITGGEKNTFRDIIPGISKN